jgi:hypothetical protein
MARLTAAQRNALPASDFAGPNRTYPVPDAAHAAAAKGRATQFASPSLKAKIDAKANEELAHHRHPGELAHHQPHRHHAHSKG